MNYFVSVSNPSHFVISLDSELDGFKKITQREAAALGLTSLSDQNVSIDPKLKALSDRQDFLEDCIAEMAQIIYA